METIANELIYNIIENLDIREILTLCSTNVKYRTICQEPYTWIYLLKRDFNLTYNGPDAYLVYKKAWIFDILKLIEYIIALNSEITAIGAGDIRDSYDALVTNIESYFDWNRLLDIPPFWRAEEIPYTLGNIIVSYNQALSTYNELINTAKNLGIDTTQYLLKYS